MTIETITWRDASAALPDADSNVLLSADELGTFEGFLDGADDNGEPVWRDVCAVQVLGVTHWADMPLGVTHKAPVVGRIGREETLLPLKNGRAVDLGARWSLPK